MKKAAYGRIVFGAAAVLFGIIALLWHDAETWQALMVILRLPLGTGIGMALMSVQVAAGVLIWFPRSVRVGSIVLVRVYLIFLLACIPAIVAAPGVWEHYPSFFEQFCAMCGTTAVYAALESNTAQRRAVRIGLGLCAASFTVSQIVYFSATASLVPKWIPGSPNFWTIATTVAFGLAAIAIVFNLRARLAMRLLTLMLGSFALLVWIPRLITHPEAHLNWSEFALTLLIMAAAWTVGDLEYA